MGSSTAAKRAAMADHMVYRKNKFAAPVGGIFLALAAIGLIAVIVFCIGYTRDILDNSGEKQSFESVVLPVMMFDPAAFEKPEDLDSIFLLRSALWATMLGEKRASYQFDAQGRLTIPAVDLDMTGARLLGPQIQLDHQSFDDNGVSYVYDHEKKCYYAPVDGQIGLYTPSVESVVKKAGSEFELTVGYIPPETAWTRTNSSEQGKPAPDKRMRYTLLWVKDHYQLISVRDIPVETSSAIPLVPTSSMEGSKGEAVSSERLPEALPGDEAT